MKKLQVIILEKIQISYKKTDRKYYGYYEWTDKYCEWIDEYYVSRQTSTTTWTNEWSDEYSEWINEYYE